MKGRVNKDLVIFMILIPIFVFFTLFLSSRMENQLPDFSIDNKSAMGYSVFFEVLRDLDYPVERSSLEVYSHNPNSIQIVADGSFNFIYNTKIIEWIEKGGILIHLTPNRVQRNYGIEVNKDSLSLNLIGDGMIISADGRPFTNRGLMESKDIPYELMLEVGSLEYDRIYFNEAHMYLTTEKENIWSVTPMGIKLILYQLLLVLAAFFYYKGKIFGRIEPLYEELQRNENEYLYSVASLYQQGKCWDIILDSYLKGLLREMNSSEEEFLDYWKESKDYNKARKIHDFLNKLKIDKRQKEKDYISIINQMEELRSKIRKGRDENWKVLK